MGNPPEHIKNIFNRVLKYLFITLKGGNSLLVEVNCSVGKQ